MFLLKQRQTLFSNLKRWSKQRLRRKTNSNTNFESNTWTFTLMRRFYTSEIHLPLYTLHENKSDQIDLLLISLRLSFEKSDLTQLMIRLSVTHSSIFWLLEPKVHKDLRINLVFQVIGTNLTNNIMNWSVRISIKWWQETSKSKDFYFTSVYSVLKFHQRKTFKISMIKSKEKSVKNNLKVFLCGSTLMNSQLIKCKHFHSHESNFSKESFLISSKMKKTCLNSTFLRRLWNQNFETQQRASHLQTFYLVKEHFN